MKRGERRQQILLTARALFSKKGYHGTTIRDIAEATGVLSGSLYAHISRKEELLFELVDQAAEEFLTSLAPIVDGPGTAAEKLTAAMAAHIKVIAHHRPHATCFFHEWRNLSPEGQALIQQKRDQYQAMLTRIVHEGIARGEFSAVDEKYAVTLVLSVVNWTYQWYNPQGPLGPEEVARRFARLVLDGLGSTKEAVS
jgi:AcrR family transcriptional regulator